MFFKFILKMQNKKLLSVKAFGLIEVMLAMVFLSTFLLPLTYYQARQMHQLTNLKKIINKFEAGINGINSKNCYYGYIQSIKFMRCDYGKVQKIIFL